jgi:hypothetical protein
MVDGKIENPLKTKFLRDLYFTSKVNHQTSAIIRGRDICNLELAQTFP